MNRQTRPSRCSTARRSVRTRTRGAAVLAGLLVAATGCGGYDDASPKAAGTHPAEVDSSATLDPCRLIPPATLDSLVGGHAEQQGPAHDEARGRACRWQLPTEGLGAAELVVTAWHGREFYLPGTIGKDVAGIGDEAQADRSLGMVLFRSSDDVVSTHVLSTPDKDLAFDVTDASATDL